MNINLDLSKHKTQTTTQVIRNIQQVRINGKKYTVGDLWNTIDDTSYYSKAVTAKGWYKTSRGVLNNLTDEFTIGF